MPATRRWLRRLLVMLVVVLGLVLCGALGTALYVRSLIHGYTSLQPELLPAGDDSQGAQEDLGERWKLFSQTLAAGQAAAPLVISSDDLNTAVERNSELRGHVHFRIADNQVVARVSWPLDRLPDPYGRWLRGRHLNGEAAVALVLREGRLTLRVTRITANDRPIPAWLLRQIQSMDFLSKLDTEGDADAVLQHLQEVRVENGIHLVPRKGG